MELTNSPDERKQISKRSRNCFICQKKFTSARIAIPQIDVDITLASAPRALPEVRRLTAVTRRSPYPTTCPEFSDRTTTAICAFNYCDAYQRWLYCSKQPGLISTARRVPSRVRVVLDKGSQCSYITNCIEEVSAPSRTAYISGNAQIEF